MEGYMSEVRLFAGNFPPRAWAFCNGATLAISEYEALFALLGTTYGGNGQTTFCLPDLRGRVPIGTGAGPGLPTIILGQVFGVEQVTLTSQTMPAHVHYQSATASEPTQNTASNAALASNGRSTSPPMPNIYAPQNPSAVAMGNNTGITGSGVPFSIIQPLLTTNYIICLEGIFPSRN